MKVNKVELNVPSSDYCKIIKDPKLDKSFHIEALLPFTEIAKLKPGNANVRPPEQKKRPFRGMMKTIEHTPDIFHLKNRGITYLCRDAQYDEERGVLTVTIPDTRELKNSDEKWGIADGGHTYQAIRNTVDQAEDYENISKWSMPSARVHFSVLKEKEPVEEIVEALNTSLQVKQYTLDEYQNKFESLKRALDEEGFDPALVAWRENEDKEWNVIEILQRLGCFLKDRFETKPPINMYKSKNKVLKLFTKEESRPEFIELFNVIKDVITLPEYIESRLSTGDIIPAKSLAKLSCATQRKLKEGKPYTRPGTDYPSTYKIDMAALMPMASAFRELLVKIDDRYEWRIDPKTLFDVCGPKLYQFLVEQMSTKHTSSELANDSEFWMGCMNIVSRAERDFAGKVARQSITRKAKPVRAAEQDEYDQREVEEDEEVTAEAAAEDKE